MKNKQNLTKAGPKIPPVKHNLKEAETNQGNNGRIPADIVDETFATKPDVNPDFANRIDKFVESFAETNFDVCKLLGN